MVAPFLNEATQRTYPYALINPLQVDEAEWRDLPSEPVVPQRFKGQAELFPRLVELHRMDELALADLAGRAQRWETECGTPYFCSLLQAQADADTVRDHLAKQMTQYHHARRAYDIVRLYDPRVLWHLNWLLEPAQWESLLGPLQRWAWPVFDGTWQSREHAPQTNDAQSSRLLFSPPQWDTLLRLGDINETLKRLRRDAPDLPQDAALARRIDALLDRAWTVHSLAESSDRQLYAEQAVRFHRDIHAHQELRACLALAQTGERTYVGACRHLDEAAMHRISSELEQLKERT